MFSTQEIVKMPRPRKKKSAHVRELLEQNPKTPIREIIDTLAQKGIKVSYNLVYGIKAKMGAKRRKLKRQKAVASANSAGIANAADLVLKVRSLANEAGGMRNLKQLVEVLGE